jgi:hypothetical protein
LFGRIAFDIKFSSDDLFYFAHIVITDMPFIRPRMHRYAIRAKTLRIDRGFYHIGIIAPATVPQSCELVDVYAELSHEAKVVSS